MIETLNIHLTALFTFAKIIKKEGELCLDLS